jgi:diguanylate cyclase (GGDEF)-like protein
MDAVRVALVALVAAILIAAPDALSAPAGSVLKTTVGYVLIAGLGHLAFRFAQRLQLFVFGGMLLVDGVFLAWSGYVTGAAESPLRFAMVLHVVAVALLASYRTGLKIALWHSLLLLVTFYAAEGGLLDASRAPGIGIGTPFQRLIEFAGLFWVVAIATSTFSAINERELRRRRYDTESLATMATMLEGATDTTAVATTIVDSVATTFDFESVVLIASADGCDPTVLASHGVEADLAGARFDPELSALARASFERTSVLVRGLDQDDDAWLDGALPGARNIVAVALVAEGHALGLLVAVHGRRLGARIARRVVSMVERFVSHGTLALRNAWLLEQIQQMARTDGLTGVANRAAFDEAIDAELGRAARQREDVSLLMIDIDHFKALNDSHGHQVGDQVLRVVGATLTGVCRDFDTAARYGGEEFALLLPATGRDDAITVAERVRGAIAAMPSEVDVTVSVGAATYPADAADAGGLIAAADGALYASKHNGRNRVTAASAMAPTPEGTAPELR